MKEKIKKHPEKLQHAAKKMLDNAAIRDNPAARENLVVNLPNLISALRIGSTPVLAWLALHQLHDYFLIVLAAALVSDGLDGYLARKYGQVTRLGAQMDSWADLIIYAVMLFGLWQLWPQILERESGLMTFAFSCWVVLVLFGVVRFRRLPSYHTYAAKLAALALAPSYFALVLWDFYWPFRGVMYLFILVMAEQLIITAVLNNWEGDVRSLWHALIMVRDKQKSEG